nr:efflux RND transporter permease subunit [Texcoconibacillus texcoconensis]
MLVIGALVLGGIALKNLAIDLFPDIEVPVAVAVTTYDGAAPQEVEQLVSRPVETAVDSIEGISSVDSVSSPGSSLVMMQFDWGVDIDNALIEVREQLDLVEGMLPDAVDRPNVMRFDPQQMPVMWIGLSGASLEHLQEIAEDDVQPHFERMPGVGEAMIEGGSEQEVRVELNDSAMNHYGIDGNTVAQLIASENSARSVGELRRGSSDLQVRIDGEFEDLSDLEATLIPTEGGQMVKLADIASVNIVSLDPDVKALVNGEEALVLSIMEQADANTVDVSNAMSDAVEDVSSQFNNDDLSLDIIIDTADFIRDSIENVAINMIIGGMMAMALLWLFLNSMRSTVVIAISIPIAVISTFTLMYFTGETLNILSMGGLALGLGMMVDSSIVIIENIYGKREHGYSINESARKGAAELAPAVIASTMTSVVVFVPIVFVEGIASELFRPLALTVTFALFAALIVSITLIPMLTSKLMSSNKLTLTEESNRGIDRLLTKVKDRYGDGISWSLRKRKTIVISSVGLIALSLTLIPLIEAEFIPAMDQGQIQIDIEGESGMSQQETEYIIHQVDDVLEPFAEDIETSYATIGSDGTGMSSSDNEAMYMLQMTAASDRDVTTQELMDKINESTSQIPGADIQVMDMDAGMGGGSPIQVEITGPELDVLEDLSEQVVWIVEGIDGTMNVESTFDEGRPELEIHIDRDIASEFGLTSQQIMDEIALRYDGQVASTYRKDGSEYDIRVALPEEERQTIRDIETARISTEQGTTIPLATVAEINQVQGPVEINRSNRERGVQVTADMEGSDLLGMMNAIEAQTDRLNMPDGYSLNFGGEGEDMMESFEQLGFALLLSIFLVYLVMAVQFESFVYPFVIMFSLPTMFVGVIVGLFVMQQSLSVPAFIGVIMLAGIVVNNAIVLVSYINILRDQGYDRIEAVIESGKSRLRPILMTSLTTALAMLPLMLGFGEGTEAQQPMAVVIVFGLMTSMIFTLILIPVMYTIIDDISLWVKRKFGRKKDELGADEVVEG